MSVKSLEATACILLLAAFKRCVALSAHRSWGPIARAGVNAGDRTRSWSPLPGRDEHRERLIADVLR